MATIRSRCRRLRLDPLMNDEVVEAIMGLGPPWSQIDRDTAVAAAKRSNGSVRGALTRLAPESEGIGALIDSVVADLPRPDPRGVARLADAIGGRSANEGYQAFHRDLYDWLAAYALEFALPSFQIERIGELWDRIRAAERETETLRLLANGLSNAEIAASAPRR